MAGYKKFNFVLFLDSSADYYKFEFYDALALSNVRLIEFNVLNADGQLTLNFKPYRPANNPAAFFKGFNGNSPQSFVEDFLTDEPVVFFFWANDYNLFRAFNFFSLLRNNYPGCKLVCRLTNPIHYYQNVQKIFVDKATTDEILSTFDCVLTYNQVDAIDYDLTYFEGEYSAVPFEQPNLTADIFFVGRPKDRLEKIFRAYEAFKAAGFVCDFYVHGINIPPDYLNRTVCTSTSI